MTKVQIRMSKAKKKLQQVFHYSDFRESQGKALATVFSSKVTFIVMPTGGGKSLCFQIPALIFKGTTIVISPLVALMKDQVDTLNKKGVKSARISYDIPKERNARTLRSLSEYKLIYVSPERVQTKDFIQALAGVHIPVIAFDEAHVISKYSKDFRPAYSKLSSILERFPKAKVICVTATADADVESDIFESLRIDDYSRCVFPPDRPNLTYSSVREASMGDLCDKVRATLEDTDGVVIIYCATRKSCELISNTLQTFGVTDVDFYHAGRAKALRDQVQNLFMLGGVRVIVATNAFGMGIDKPDVRLVYHWHMPGSLFDYYQEAGRAGRDGQPSECVLNVSKEGKTKRNFFHRMGNPNFQTYQKAWNFITRYSQESATPVFQLSRNRFSAACGLPPAMQGQGQSVLNFMEYMRHVTLYPSSFIYRLPIRNRSVVTRYTYTHNVRVEGNVCIVTVPPSSDDPVNAMASEGGVTYQLPKETLMLKKLVGALAISPADVSHKDSVSSRQFKMLEEYANASDKPKYLRKAFLVTQQTVD